MIPIFQELSKKIGMKKVIWRYDPIILQRSIVQNTIKSV